MSIIPDQIAFCSDLGKLLAYIDTSSLRATEGDGYRDPRLQSRYVELGISWTKNSEHGDRLAHDLNFFNPHDFSTLVTDEESIAPIGLYWESLNPKNHWGYFDDKGKRFDLFHFGRRA